MTSRLVTRCPVLVSIVAALLSGCADQPQAQTRADVVTVGTDTSAPNREAEMQAPQQELVIDSRGLDPIAEIPVPQQEFEVRLLEIAQSYESYGRVYPDFEWALMRCALAPDVPDLAISTSADSRAHGRKIYALYAKLRPSPGMYISDETANPVGQTVVKESWVPEEFDPEAEGERALPARKARRRGQIAGSDDNSITSQTIVLDGRHFRPKEKGDLFIMFKLNPGTPGTDEGWVYGTLTPDGKTVTAAGRVASCMSCHLEAPYDRLFGPHVRANRTPAPQSRGDP